MRETRLRESVVCVSVCVCVCVCVCCVYVYIHTHTHTTKSPHTLGIDLTNSVFVQRDWCEHKNNRKFIIG